ncbi:hypothetical protein CH35J_011320 [Colletotrichum higginsianum]|uniref:Uncharacterized protein n=2 Tax=Colletotrichum higginsianum TaxID=80884 RepID=A0A4T0VGH4_9PEZI|nr:hypothetical protein CH35J_011320 [Colletotrichum higginsianum]
MDELNLLFNPLLTEDHNRDDSSYWAAFFGYSEEGISGLNANIPTFSEPDWLDPNWREPSRPESSLPGYAVADSLATDGTSAFSLPPVDDSQREEASDAVVLVPKPQPHLQPQANNIIIDALRRQPMPSTSNPLSQHSMADGRPGRALSYGGFPLAQHSNYHEGTLLGESLMANPSFSAIPMGQCSNFGASVPHDYLMGNFSYEGNNNNNNNNNRPVSWDPNFLEMPPAQSATDDYSSYMSNPFLGQYSSFTEMLLDDAPMENFSYSNDGTNTENNPLQVSHSRHSPVNTTLVESPMSRLLYGSSPPFLQGHYSMEGAPTQSPMHRSPMESPMDAFFFPNSSLRQPSSSTETSSTESPPGNLDAYNDPWRAQPSNSARASLADPPMGRLSRFNELLPVSQHHDLADPAVYEFLTGQGPAGWYDNIPFCQPSDANQAPPAVQHPDPEKQAAASKREERVKWSDKALSEWTILGSDAADAPCSAPAAASATAPSSAAIVGPQRSLEESEPAAAESDQTYTSIPCQGPGSRYRPGHIMRLRERKKADGGSKDATAAASSPRTQMEWCHYLNENTEYREADVLPSLPPRPSAPVGYDSTASFAPSEESRLTYARFCPDKGAPADDVPDNPDSSDLPSLRRVVAEFAKEEGFDLDDSAETLPQKRGRSVETESDAEPQTEVETEPQTEAEAERRYYLRGPGIQHGRRIQNDGGALGSPTRKRRRPRSSRGLGGGTGNGSA